MIAKVLSWCTLAACLVFIALSLTSLFGWDSLGEETARSVFYFGAVPLLAVSILLAVALLVVSAFGSNA